MSVKTAIKPIVIAKVGNTFNHTAQRNGDLEAMISGFLNDDAVTVIDVRAGEPMPAPEACAGAVISGSSDMVTDNLPWSLRLEQWI